MLSVIEITNHSIQITLCENIVAFDTYMQNLELNHDIRHTIATDTYNEYTSMVTNTRWIVVNTADVTLDMPVPDGWLTAKSCNDPDYRGLDIEYIPDNDSEYSEITTRPRVLIEKPAETKELVAMVWADKTNEDYTNKHIFR